MSTCFYDLFKVTQLVKGGVRVPAPCLMACSLKCILCNMPGFLYLWILKIVKSLRFKPIFEQKV